MRTRTWTAIWVDDMPPSLEPGKLYISVKHRLTEHLCACGCGTEVSLPLGGSEWRIEYDGESVRTVTKITLLSVGFSDILAA